MKEFFKNEKVKEILLLIVISLVFISPYFIRGDIYVGHDLTFHLNRLIGIKDALCDGQFLPKIYPLANNGFGYASPLFYCDLFLIPFALLLFIGVTPILSYKIMIALVVIFVSFSVFYLSKKVFKKTKVSYILTFAYLFNSYVLYDLYARSSLGEFFALAIIPWVLYAIYKILIKEDDSWVLLGVSFVSLVMCHLISAYVYVFIFAISIIIYIITNKSIKKIFQTLLKGSILGFLLAMWFILPMFEQMHSQEFYINYNSQHFIISETTQNIFNILTPISHMDLNGRYIFDIISVGPFMLILPFIYLFVKKNKYINIIIVFVVISLMLMLGILPIPNILSILQFAFRFNIIVLPLLTVLLGYILDTINNRLYNTLSIVLSVFVCLNFIIFTNELLNDGKYYLNNNATKNEINNVTSSLYSLDYNHDELGGAEYLPYTVNTDYINDSLKILRIDENGGGIQTDIAYNRNYSKLSFEYSGEACDVMLPMSFYKGYKAYKFIDGNQLDYSLYNMEVFKKIALHLDGDGKYVVKYEGTIIQHASLMVSSITLLCLIGYKIKRGKNV